LLRNIAMSAVSAAIAKVPIAHIATVGAPIPGRGRKRMSDRPLMPRHTMAARLQRHERREKTEMSTTTPAGTAK